MDGIFLEGIEKLTPGLTNEARWAILMTVAKGQKKNNLAKGKGKMIGKGFTLNNHPVFKVQDALADLVSA